MISKVGFGGGCHWCTEAVFQSVKGVTHVGQGWIASEAENSALSEGVIVTFDSDEVCLCTLIEIHLQTHSSNSNHAFRAKYRSAIYVIDKDQSSLISGILYEIQDQLGRGMNTKVLPLVSFKKNKAPFLNYYKGNPDAPFCQTYIIPKINMLKKSHGKHLSV